MKLVALLLSEDRAAFMAGRFSGWDAVAMRRQLSALRARMAVHLVGREKRLEAESGNGLMVVDKHCILPVKAVPRSKILQNTFGVAAGEAG